MSAKIIQKFNLHSHTYRCGHSDLDMSDEEYVKEYMEMGFEKIAFTDHYPQKNIIDNRKRVRMDYQQNQEYLESINELKNKYKNEIEILSGYEVEYLDEEKENLIELKKQSDYIVLGQHYIYDENKNLKILGKCEFGDEELLEYSNNVEKAVKAGIPNIIAHPDIYLTNRKVFSDIEEIVAHNICSVAEKYNIPLEINLNNIFQKTYNENRILNNLPVEEQKKKLDKVNYPRKEFWEIVSEYDINVVYGLDAHYRGQVLKWNELIELANFMIGKEIVSKLKFIV